MDLFSAKNLSWAVHKGHEYLIGTYGQGTYRTLIETEVVVEATGWSHSYQWRFESFSFGFVCSLGSEQKLGAWVLCWSSLWLLRVSVHHQQIELFSYLSGDCENKHFRDFFTCSDTMVIILSMAGLLCWADFNTNVLWQLQGLWEQC